MRAVKNLIHVLLITAILVAGIPLHHQGDANRDDQVDLADAILRVQGVALTAEQPAVFRENLENALITLSAVAGFTKVIKADRGLGTRSGLYGTTVFGPVVYYESGPLSVAALPHCGRPFLYRSIDLAPQKPPPISTT
jgi:hypothetical protein